jgi:hypothetical protein
MKTLSQLPIGARFADRANLHTVLRVAGHKIPGYPGTIGVADNIVMLGCFDACEPNNPDRGRASGGNNHYPVSNVHQWLNAVEDDWYQPQHEHDEPPITKHVYSGDNPYASKPGFLTRFSDAFVEALAYAEIRTLNKTNKARVWLLSATEIGFDKNGTEGMYFPLFDDPRMRRATPTQEAVYAADTELAGFSTRESWRYFLRSPYAASSSNVRLVYLDGTEYYSSAFDGRVGLRPAFLLQSEISVSDEPDECGIYLV